jgi:hypothetical protein
MVLALRTKKSRSGSSCATRSSLGGSFFGTSSRRDSLGKGTRRRPAAHEGSRPGGTESYGAQRAIQAIVMC